MKAEVARPLGGSDCSDEDYAIHPTEMIVRGMKDGKAFKSLISMDRLADVMERSLTTFGVAETPE